eukprot:2747392-Pleurochrysis_carterae.AAC.1
MPCRLSLRARLRTSTRGVASASLMSTTSHEPTRYAAKAIALNPVASSSREVMCSHVTCSGESSKYQYMP